MRGLALCAIISLAIISCNKNNSTPTVPNNNNPGNPSNPSGTTAWFIPNWLADDTLVGYEVDAAGDLTGVLDTIFTYTDNDTSFITYKGKQYYIWAETGFGADSFKADDKSYTNCVISPTTNKADAISKSTLNAIYPHQYKNAQGDWEKQVQELTINDWTNFRRCRYNTYVGSFKKLQP